MQSDLAALKEGQRETNSALNAIRIHMVAMAQDSRTSTLCSRVTRRGSTVSKDNLKSPSPDVMGRRDTPS